MRAPSKAHLGKIAKNLGLDLDDDELSAYQRSIKDACDAINEVECLPEPLLPTKYPRVPGHRPTPEENPLNAWYVTIRSHFIGEYKEGELTNQAGVWGGGG